MFNKHKFKRYFANTSWLVIDQLYGRVLALIVTVLLSRYLGPESFGVYSYAFSVVGLFVLICNLGIDDLIVRDMVTSPDKEPALLGTALLMKLMGTVVFFLVVSSFALISGDKDALYLILILAVAPFLRVFSVIDLSFQAHVQVRFSVMCNLFVSTVNAFLVLGCIYYELSVFWLAALQVVQAFLLAVLLLGAYRLVRGSVWRWRFDRGMASGLFKEAWPLMLSLAVVSVYIHCDKIIVNYLLGNAATGEYAVASKLSEAWYFIPTVVVASLMPAIVQFKATDVDHYYKRLQNLFDLMVVLAVLIAIPVTIFSDLIIDLLFGADYTEAAGVLAAHVWGAVLVFLGAASGKWMIIEGYSKLYFYRSVVGVLMNVLGNFLLIPRYGVVGAAYATIVAQFFVVILFDLVNVETRRCFKMKIRACFPVHWLLGLKGHKV